MDDVISRYYLRLLVEDRPGVLAQISSILGRSQISISSVIQPERQGRFVPLIIMLHQARNAALQRAMKHIQRLSSVKARPVVLRVETFES
jgi:homoserine dehydrogenase